jgi:hypothetical protein
MAEHSQTQETIPAKQAACADDRTLIRVFMLSLLRVLCPYCRFTLYKRYTSAKDTTRSGLICGDDKYQAWVGLEILKKPRIVLPSLLQKCHVATIG